MLQAAEGVTIICYYFLYIILLAAMRPVCLYGWPVGQLVGFKISQTTNIEQSFIVPTGLTPLTADPLSYLVAPLSGHNFH